MGAVTTARADGTTYVHPPAATKAAQADPPNKQKDGSKAAPGTPANTITPGTCALDKVRAANKAYLDNPGAQDSFENGHFIMSGDHRLNIEITGAFDDCLNKGYSVDGVAAAMKRELVKAPHDYLECRINGRVAEIKHIDYPICDRNLKSNPPAAPTKVNSQPAPATPAKKPVGADVCADIWNYEEGEITNDLKKPYSLLDDLRFNDVVRADLKACRDKGVSEKDAAQAMKQRFGNQFLNCRIDYRVEESRAAVNKDGFRTPNCTQYPDPQPAPAKVNSQPAPATPAKKPQIQSRDDVIAGINYLWDRIKNGLNAHMKKDGYTPPVQSLPPEDQEGAIALANKAVDVAVKAMKDAYRDFPSTFDDIDEVAEDLRVKIKIDIRGPQHLKDQTSAPATETKDSPQTAPATPPVITPGSPANNITNP